MECNKDEAYRAKEIAERKFREEDYTGARKLAVKAKKLYPELEGISRLVDNLDIHICDTVRRNGEVDWYKVLGVSVFADKEAIKKRYRKLALLTHPDRNNQVGAERAFQLLVEAFTVLSDDTSRSAYNQKVNIQPAVQPNVLAQTWFSAPRHSSAQPSSNMFQDVFPQASPSSSTRSGGSTVPSFYNSASQKKKKKKASTEAARDPATPAGVAGSKVGSKAPSPADDSGRASAAPRPGQRMQKTSFWTICTGCKKGFEYHLIFRDQRVRCSNCKQAFQALETDVPMVINHEHASASCGPSAAKRVRKAKGDANTEGKRRKPNDETTRERSGGPPDSSKINKGDVARKTTREVPLPPSDVRQMLIRIGFLKVSEGVDRWRAAKEAVAAKKEATSVTEVNSMSVPDADFHDFDKERSHMDLKENDLWAVYDDNDGMPRLYALIRRVISLEPFKVEMSWLNSKGSKEFGSLVDWIGHGFRKTCGNFKIGKDTLDSHSSSIFSHRVKLVKGRGGVVQIYPAKGDVWALYKNWSADWSFRTAKALTNAYEVVEVLSDYNAEQGASVIPLVKVAGFRTVFSRGDLKEAKRIRKEEMFRFSHRIPCHLLSGKEAPNAPGGCLELDPASLSEELLKVVDT